MKTIFKVVRISRVVNHTYDRINHSVDSVFFTTKDAAMEFAEQECQHIGEDVRYLGNLCIPKHIIHEVSVFETLEEVVKIDFEEKKRKALNKLTPEERLILGLEI